MTTAAQYVCTNCHHVGQGKMAGSGYLELLMWVFLTPIAIWYSLSRSKHRHGDCPSCRGSKTMIPVTSPRGAQLVQGALGTEQPVTPTAAAQTAVGAVSGGQKGGLGSYWMVLAALGCVLLAPVIVKYTSPDNTPQPMPQATIARQVDREAVQAAFLANPSAQIDELKAILARRDYGLANQRLSLLEGIENTELYKLREQTKEGLERLASQRSQEQQAAAYRAGERQALVSKALVACKRAIADAVGATGSAMIPDSANHANDIDPDEFYFAWPRGTFQLETTLGNANMSASCIGSLRRSKVMELTVNGRDVMIRGRRVGD